MDAGPFTLSFSPPTFTSHAEERLHRKQRLAATFRLFAKFGYDEGVAGHVTVRDPEHPETFWVNPFGVDFGLIRVRDLIRVDHEGETVDGQLPVNRAAFVIHSRIHQARPDVIAAAQDACAFYGDHALYDDFGGVVVDFDEGQRIAKALGTKKAVILANHGLLTVAETVDAAAWWFITLDRSCRAELLARAAGEPREITAEAAQQSFTINGNPLAGWFQFQPLYQRIVHEQPDVLE
jgi:ribulose-5-phosphate 4-epimerase/fuculose-1-phosphate aldolase